MDIIGFSYEEMLGAVNDYLMASFDRTDWAARGEVDESSFDDLNETLKQSWKNKQRVCRLINGERPEQDQGQILYSDCMQFVVPVQAMSPPGYFIPGCFHMLADDFVVGWHPSYETRLKGEKVV